MKQVTIISGKGGTGKTTLSASFAVLARKSVVADCDVDASNLHLLLDPSIEEEQEFRGSMLAVIDKDLCNECGVCEETCRFNAIKDLVIDPIMCEGCGVCAEVCPLGAVSLEEKVTGRVFLSKTKYGPMSHARLKAAEGASGKLVTLVRSNARSIAERRNHELVLIDGPPGIGCPVIAALTGVDMAIIVTEPTMSGLHDMERMLGVTQYFRIPSHVCVNMYDINIEKTKEIGRFCRGIEVEVVGKIPFDPIVTEAMVAGKPVVEYSPDSPASREIKDIWNKVITRLKS